MNYKCKCGADADIVILTTELFIAECAECHDMVQSYEEYYGL